MKAAKRGRRGKEAGRSRGWEGSGNAPPASLNATPQEGLEKHNQPKTFSAILQLYCLFPSFSLFTSSVVSDSLRPHRLQHIRLPCPSPSPGACSNSIESVMPSTIASPVAPFSTCPQSFPASGSSPLSQMLQSIKSPRPLYGPIVLTPCHTFQGQLGTLEITVIASAHIGSFFKIDHVTLQAWVSLP